MIEQIFDAYGSALLNYLTFRLGSSSDAEDVLQDVMLRLASRPDRLKEIDNVRAYVYQIARNESLRFQAKVSRERNAVSDYAKMLEYVSSAFTRESPGREADLAYLLSKLPEKQREVVVLKVYAGLTLKEIGSLLSESINTVSSRYQYALEKMKLVAGEADGTRTKHRKVAEGL